MSIKHTNLSAKATCFIPREALTRTFLNSDPNSAIRPHKSCMVNMDSFRNQHLNSNGQIYDFSYLPLNANLNLPCIPQLIYAWPEYPYAISSQSISLPVNISYNDPYIYNQNNLLLRNKDINYHNTSFKLSEQNIEIFNNNDKINSIEKENTTIIHTENKEPKNEIVNETVEPSVLNLETLTNNGNNLPHNVPVVGAKNVKKKKGKSFIYHDEYEKIKGHDKLKTVDNFIKPSLASDSYAAMYQNNGFNNFNNFDFKLRQNSCNIITQASNSENKTDSILNLSDSTEIIINEKKSDKLLYNNNISKLTKDENIANIEVITNLEKPKFSYSAIVKNGDNVDSKKLKNNINSFKIKIDKNKKYKFKELCLDDSMPKQLEKNCVQTVSNLSSIYERDDVIKSKDIKEKEESSTTKINEIDNKNHLSNKNWTSEGKLLFNEWKKSRSKYSEENKRESPQPFIVQQTAHLLTSKHKNNQTCKASSPAIYHQKSENIKPKEESKDNYIVNAESENWFAVKNRNRAKVFSENCEKTNNLEISKNLNQDKFRVNSLKPKLVETSEKVGEFTQLSTYLTKKYVNKNIQLNKHVNAVIVNTNLEMNNKDNDNNCAKYWNADSNITHKFKNKIASNMDLKYEQHSSKNELIYPQNAKNSINYPSHFSNIDYNKNINSTIKEDSQNLNKSIQKGENRKIITPNPSKEHNLTDHRAIMATKMKNNKKLIPRNQSQPPLGPPNQSQQNTRKSEAPILLDFSKLFQMKKNNKNEVKSKLKSSKKKKVPTATLR